MKRREFFGTVAAAVGTAQLARGAGIPPQQSSAKVRPNIVLIMADDMGYSDLGCFGSEINTPHVNALARGGLRFSHFYNVARCCPTRACLLTGVYPHQAGIGDMEGDMAYPTYRGELSRNCITIAEGLRAGGYQTFMTGKWHVTQVTHSKDNWPLQRGFDRYFGTIAGAGSYFNPVTLTLDNSPIHPDAEDFYYTDAITGYAVRFLGDADPNRPFFLYVAFTSPHWPLHAPAEVVGKYRGRYARGWDALRRERYERLVKLGLVKDSWPLAPRDPDVPAWEEVPHKSWHERRMEVYAAQVEIMDRGVGRIVAQLKALGQLDNTLLIFLSDNGGCHEEILERWGFLPIPLQTKDGQTVHVGNDPDVPPGPPETYASYGRGWANLSNTPFRLFKHWTHEGGIASPLIIHWPARISSGGKITHEMGHLTDLMATFLDVAETPYPNTYQGHPIIPAEGTSLLPIIAGQEHPPHPPLFWEHEGSRAVLKGKWKLVSSFNHAWELHDMDADRTETNDLASKYPEKVAELEKDYEAWAGRCGVVPWEIVRRLRVELHLRFQEASTTAFAWDDSGNERHLLRRGRALTERRGWDVRTFDGEFDYLDLTEELAPNPTKHALTLAAVIRPARPDGVILAHGDTRLGYALYLKGGKLTFAVNCAAQHSQVQSRESVGDAWVHVAAVLDEDGKATVFVNGEQASEAVEAALLTEKPAGGLLVGNDLGEPVGEYGETRLFQGAISDLKLVFGACPLDWIAQQAAQFLKPREA